MQNYHQQLQLKAMQDLGNRSKAGVFMYLVTWLCIAMYFDLQTVHPLFFQANLAALCILSIIRFIQQVKVTKVTSDQVSSFSTWFNGGIMLCGLHWGLMVSWVILEPKLEIAQMVFLLATPAFALGGSCMLCISNEIRATYPSLLLLPPLFAHVYINEPAGPLIAGLIVLTLVYIHAASKASQEDYWDAVTNRLVSEQRAEAMAQLSITDPLTQLKNRMHFDDEFEQAWKQGIRTKKPLAMVMFDVDHFKSINDTHGHLFGDTCLKVIANAIADEVKRPTDCIARYGGEEFVALLPDTDAAGAAILGERVRRTIEKLRLHTDSGEPLALSLSAGGASIIPNHHQDKNVLIQQADSALYAAKRNGRNQYQDYRASQKAIA